MYIFFTLSSSLFYEQILLSCYEKKIVQCSIKHNWYEIHQFLLLYFLLCETLSRSTKTSLKQICVKMNGGKIAQKDTRHVATYNKTAWISCRYVASKGNDFDLLRQILAYSLCDGLHDYVRNSPRPLTKWEFYDWLHYCIIYITVFADPFL